MKKNKKIKFYTNALNLIIIYLTILVLTFSIFNIQSIESVIVSILISVIILLLILYLTWKLGREY